MNKKELLLPDDRKQEILEIAEPPFPDNFNEGSLHTAKKIRDDFEDDMSALASYDPEMFDSADLIKTVESVCYHWQEFKNIVAELEKEQK